MKKYFAALVVFAAAWPLARAQTIVLLNPSFEDPTPSGATSDDNFTTSSTGWTSLGTAGNFDPAIAGISPAPPDGAQWGYANSGGTLQQAVSDAFAANQLYTFTVDMSNRSDAGGSASGAIVLGYMDAGSFTPLGSQSATFSPSDAYSAVTGVYQTASGPEIGMPIAIQLTNTASNQVLFDLAQISVSAIPEPATYAAILGGLALGLAARQRIRPRKLAA